MSRRVFFSFHYKEDIWRVSQVRNSWVTKGRTTNSFLDAAAWESVKRRGTRAVKDWIDRQMDGTHVTVVLIGAETSSRKYVKYEIEQTIERGAGLVGIYIHKLRNKDGVSSPKGANPLDEYMVENDGFFNFLRPMIPASEKFTTYEWIGDGGYENLNRWIQEAAAKAKDS